MKRLLRINIKATKRPAPAANPMNGNTIIGFNTVSRRPSECSDLDVVTASKELMRKHSYVQVTPAYQRRRVTVGYLKDPHYPTFCCAEDLWASMAEMSIYVRVGRLAPTSVSVSRLRILLGVEPLMEP